MADAIANPSSSPITSSRPHRTSSSDAHAPTGPQWVLEINSGFAAEITGMFGSNLASLQTTGGTLALNPSGRHSNFGKSAGHRTPHWSGSPEGDVNVGLCIILYRLRPSESAG